MKKKILFLAAFFILIINANAQFNAPCAPIYPSGVIHQIFFLNADTGFAAGENLGKGKISRTTDGGNTWTNVYTSATNLEWVYDVCFTDASTGFAACENGIILATTNGGANWFTAFTSANVAHFKSIYFPSALVGYAVGDGNPQGPIYKTTDGGNTWAAQTSNATSFLSDVFFTDNSNGYAVGDFDVLKTTDGGTTWSKITTITNPLNFEYTSVYSLSANTCYVVAAIEVKKTNDGGNTWTTYSFPPLAPPNVYYSASIRAIDSLTWYAVGANIDTTTFNGTGAILKSIDAGQTWNNINTPTNNTLLLNKFVDDVCFLDPQTGYVAGDDGVILKTTNGACGISISVSTTNSSCGQANGASTASASSGIPPYTYQWTNGDLTASADSLSAGLYMVYVTDASGCKAQDAVMINDISSPTITVTSATDILCNGGNNGSINISVTGGTLPYTYLWGNGNTNQNMSNLQAGPHQIQVTDANGCKATKIVLLTEPAKITLADSIQNASCGSSDGAAGVIASGGTSPYTYAWSTGATTQVVTGLSAGSYSVLVTDANGCTKAGQGTIINVGSATATIDSIVPASCSSGTGSIYVSVNGGAPPYTYSWTNGSTTQDLVGVAPGMYGLTIYGSNPCTGAFSTSLPNEMPQAPVICIVSVDTGTGKNQCAFIKDSVANLKLKQYNFYRETTQSGVYQKLGSKAANLQNIWTDQSANPLQRAWRYKITAEDSCGNESPISVLHKTIHLVANLGISNNVNLIWDDYEGFSYNTFVIWRYTPATGWDSLDAVASSDHSYSDFNPPTFTNLFYFIEVIHPNGCSVQVKYPDPMASNLNSSRSNTYKLNQSGTSVQDDFFGADVQVYPNPSSGEFIIQGLQPSAQITVYNMLGKKVHESTAVKKQETMSLNAPSGIYLLKVKSDKGELTRKVVIQSR